MAEVCPTCTELWVPFLAPNKPSLAVLVVGGESRRTRSSRSPWLQSKFEVSLGYVRPSVKSKEGKRKEEKEARRREEGRGKKKREGKREGEKKRNTWISEVTP